MPAIMMLVSPRLSFALWLSVSVDESVFVTSFPVIELMTITSFLVIKSMTITSVTTLSVAELRSSFSQKKT